MDSDFKQIVNKNGDCTDCNLGPVLMNIMGKLDTLDAHSAETKVFQKEVSKGMTELAVQQEKIIAITEKVDVNKNDVSKLYSLYNKHIANHPIAGDVVAKSKKFDKIETSIIVAMLLGIGAAIMKVWK